MKDGEERVKGEKKREREVMVFSHRYLIGLKRYIWKERSS